jgi:hypothetical protein
MSTDALMNEARQRMRLRHLRDLWLAAKKIPNFDTFGDRNLDCEIARAWGDWRTSKKPYDNPYNAEIKEKRAYAKRAAKNEISPWGRYVVDKIREMPAFEDCPAFYLDDKPLARLIWYHWQALKGPNKLVRILEIILRDPGLDFDRWDDPPED